VFFPFSESSLFFLFPDIREEWLFWVKRIFFEGDSFRAVMEDEKGASMVIAASRTLPYDGFPFFSDVRDAWAGKNGTASSWKTLFPGLAFFELSTSVIGPFL